MYPICRRGGRKFYVKAYDEVGNQIFGLLRGQGVIRCEPSMLKNTIHYQNLKRNNFIGNKYDYRMPLIAYYRIYDEWGNMVDELVPDH